MLWFLFALTGYLLLAMVFVLDKLILTKTLDKPVVYTFYSTIFMVLALLAWPFGVQLLVMTDWLWAFVSGIAFGLALWSMFIAVKREEASHINPFIGAITTIITYALAALFLAERLTTESVWGVITLFAATLLLSLFGEGRKPGLSRGLWWGVAAGLLFAVSHSSAKYLYEIYPFLTAFVWTRATTALVGFMCLFSPAVRRTFRRKESETIRRCRSCGYSRTYTVALVAATKLLGVVAVICIQYAIAIGSVTVVNALVGLQYAFMFLLIYLSTRYIPKIFKEHFSRKELAIETAAIVLVLFGSALFVL